MNTSKIAAQSWTPALLIPEEFTPLPVIDHALPIIGLFARLAGQGSLARYRVAMLRELATQTRARLSIRAMRGLQTDKTPQIIITGHALMQNLCRGHYELAVDIPLARRLAAAFAERGHAI